jgi:hypothetical protein
MATRAIPLVNTQYVPTTATLAYQAVNVRTQVTKASFVSQGNTNTITVYLVPSGGTVGNDDRIVVAKSLAPSEEWQCPSLVGHVLAPGDAIWWLASAPSLVVGRISGIEYT